MKREFEKGMRILSNLVSFCATIGSECYHMEMLNKDDCLYIVIRADADEVSEEQLQDLRESLAVPRQHEMEQYYWELIGEFDSNAELSLVGMMVDSAEIIYENKQLCISVQRRP